MTDRAREDARIRAAGYYDDSLARDGSFWRKGDGPITMTRESLLDRLAVEEAMAPALASQRRRETAQVDAQRLLAILKIAANYREAQSVVPLTFEIFRRLFGRDPVIEDVDGDA